MKWFGSVREFIRKTALWIVLAPVAVSFLGAASNQAVLIANNDTFPVKINVVKIMHSPLQPIQIQPSGKLMLDDVHCLMTDKTHLNALGDIFDFHDDIMSVGDLLLKLGEWLSGYSFIIWIVVIIGKLRNEQI